jgi:PIN domain nuclease of toxin-antitoxin system
LNPQSFELQEALSLSQISILEISFQHVVKVATLPFHHRDSFDRLIIAQSLVETIPIISVDAAFDAYGVTRVW